MAKRKGKVNSRSVIGILLIILVLVLCVGGIAYLAKNGDTLDSQFYLQYGNTFIRDSAEGLVFTVEKTESFKIISLAGNAEYSISVVSAPSEAFDYAVNGEIQAYKADMVLTPYFSIETLDNVVQITPKYDLEKILEHLAIGEITFPNGEPKGDFCKLCITNGEKTVTVNFSILFGCPVESVWLSDNILVI